MKSKIFCPGDLLIKNGKLYFIVAMSWRYWNHEKKEADVWLLGPHYPQLKKVRSGATTTFEILSNFDKDLGHESPMESQTDCQIKAIPSGS
jgi:hypothetical protein